MSRRINDILPRGTYPVKLYTRVISTFIALTTIITTALPAFADPASPIPLPTVKAEGDYFGIVEAFQAPDLAIRSGARWQRFAFFWNSIQPELPTDWDSNHYSTPADVSRAVADGITPVGIIGNPPEWATRNGSVPKNLDLPISDPENYWARFIERLVREYAGQIDYWVIWNEPDVKPDSPGSTWAGSEEEYYKLLKTASIQAKAVDPKAKIIFAGTTYWYDFNRNEPLFFERVLRDATKIDPTAKANGYYFDAVDVHLYSTPDQIRTVPSAYREAMNKYGFTKPVWISEMNVVPADDPAASVPRSGHRSSLDEQASYVIEALALSRVAGVEKAAIYKMIDGTIVGGEPYGLVRNDLSVRPAYVAFQVAAEYLSISGQAYYKQENGYAQVVIAGEKQRVTVVWATGATPAQAKIPMTGTGAKLILKDGTTRNLAPPQNSDLTYVVNLPGATANTDDGDPSRYIIGGSPTIISETMTDEPFELSPDELYFPSTGFTSAGPFLDYYKRRGGSRTFGYPISRQFTLEGHTVQFYQRQVMELRSDNTIGLLNLLDEGLMPYTVINGATIPPIDENLTKSAPAPDSPDYASKIIKFVKSSSPDTWEKLAVGFHKTFSRTVTAADAFPDEKSVDQGIVDGLNLELWGVPTSAPARDPNNADFVYQRFQRGVMHYDKQTGATQGLLLADYLKSIITGVGLPPDLEVEAKDSRFYHQYDNSLPDGLSRPADLGGTNMKNAFEHGR